MQLNWSVKPFETLTVDALYALLRLRQDVFMLEQECLYPELDGKDEKAMHLMGEADGTLVSYARLFAPGDYFSDNASFGRVVTSLQMRGKGLGKQLTKQCIDQCQQLWPGKTIEISGQEYLNKFYCGFGFEPHGEVYLEDDIDHRRFFLRV
ncbi:MAG: GNAT family N-acetyltransferase [Coxiella sp. (in: Bacteria)]|nr:MAG: GNAT family N-acetyltransferase [Coxiella sp. (in: g-proteobacteria)]